MTTSSTNRGLVEAAQAVVDAAKQDAAGAWIITGDGEVLMSDLSEALSVLQQAPLGDEREAVAKIIDGWPFGIMANIAHTERAAVDRDLAYAKADQIIALLRPPPSVPEGMK